MKKAILALVTAAMAASGSAAADAVAPRECTSGMNYGAHVLSIKTDSGGQRIELDVSPLVVSYDTLSAIAQAAGVGSERIDAIVVSYREVECKVSEVDSQVLSCSTFALYPPVSRPVAMTLRLADGREVAAGSFTGSASIYRVSTLTTDGEGKDYVFRLGLNGDGDNHNYLNGEKSALNCR